MTENIRKDIDVKLLAGAVIGLRIGLAGYYLVFQMATRVHFLVGCGAAHFGLVLPSDY